MTALTDILRLADFDEERERISLLRERDAWNARYKLGLENEWSVGAMRIIRSEQHRLNELLWNRYRIR